MSRSSLHRLSSSPNNQHPSTWFFFWQFYMRATLAYRKAQLTSSVIDVATRLPTSLAKVNGGNDANKSSLVSPFRQFLGDGATSHLVSFQGFAHRVRIISRDDVLDTSPSRIVELLFTTLLDQLRVQLQARVLTKVVLKIVRVEVFSCNLSSGNGKTTPIS